YGRHEGPSNQAVLEFSSLGRVAPKAPHELARRVAGICQEGSPDSPAVTRTSPRDRALLWMDRWPDGVQQGGMVAPALYTPRPAEQVVRDQLSGGRPIASTGVTNAGGPGAGSCRGAGRPVQGRVGIPGNDH